jgi:primary-amine oxidase
MKVAFKPVNFFTRNPSIDVPASTQQVNQSTLISRTGTSATTQQCCSSDTGLKKTDFKL